MHFVDGNYFSITKHWFNILCDTVVDLEISTQLGKECSIVTKRYCIVI